MRNLASIQQIISLQPIPGADAIEVAEVLGWKCVVKKGEFKVGDFGVYFEIDSILPELEVFEFMRPRKFRVKTIKLRGQISQGLFMPLSNFELPKDVKLGTDLTEWLCVTKYDPEINDPVEKIVQRPARNIFEKFLMRFSWYRKFFVKKVSGDFPKFIVKTDETRIQAMPDLLYRLWYDNVPLYATEKLDGQSSTYFLVKKPFGKLEFGVCSRNNRLPFPDGSNWWKIAEQEKMEYKLSVLWQWFKPKNNLVLQGEIVGNGIQGNKYGLKGIHFYGYNLIIDGESKNPKDVGYILEAVGLKAVPILGFEKYATEEMDEFVSNSDGPSVLKENVLREGIVYRTSDAQVSFKAISAKFLLKNDL